jgi:multicomponent Na+:H+ antiporter subunit G
MTTSELGILLLASVGVFFMVVSGVGVLRLPDVYTRMHAASAAITIGIGCILLAAGFTYGQWELVRMLLLIVLFYITGPIATTSMARAAYRTDYEGRLVLHYDELAVHDEQLDDSSPPPVQPR